MRVLILFAVLGLAPLAAETVWTLKSGPDSAASIPVVPVQPVPAWKGSYVNGDETVWVYVTRSPYFFSPGPLEGGAVPGTPWTVALFFPEAWKSAERTAWLRDWVVAFQSLATLPQGFPVVFPAVLRKN